MAPPWILRTSQAILVCPEVEDHGAGTRLCSVRVFSEDLAVLMLRQACRGDLTPRPSDQAQDKVMPSTGVVNTRHVRLLPV